MTLFAMARRVVVGVALAALPLAGTPVMTAQAASAHDAKDIAGQWQGTLEIPQRSLRLALVITKGDKGWTGKFHSIDQQAPAFNATVTLQGQDFTAAVSTIGASYTGKLSADGNTITGSWTQGPTPLPLTLVRATKETAWEIPAPPPPQKLMAADADPAFDVATIKPNDSGATSIQQLTMNGRDFRVRAASLADLISFTYAVQVKQIVGAPDWFTKDRYDLSAVPDTEGAPNDKQIRTMMKKLLADRFKLKFHEEKRDMGAFVLTVADAAKLKPTEIQGSLPGLGFRPMNGNLQFIARNATIDDVKSLLQVLVLDRPVVDRTGLTGKYDITATFTPDDSLFNGHSPLPPSKTENTEAAPNFFEAMQKEAGLKLSPEKTQVDVMVIDHVEKPSAN
jgi:uncharacterized protein (TIGR03435 family)